MELSFPAGVTAAATDVWTLQPAVSLIEVTVIMRDGQSHSSSLTSRKRPDRTFFGVVAESDIASMRFKLPQLADNRKR